MYNILCDKCKCELTRDREVYTRYYAIISVEYYGQYWLCPECVDELGGMVEKWLKERKDD